MKILVTGGAGFIGSHLCRRLLEDGHHVICMDNFSSGWRGNIESLLSHYRFQLIEHDVQIPLLLQVDQVYHLACPASPVHYQADPVNTMKTALLGSLNMLELARLAGATILLASTSEVYGNPLVHPQGEEYWGNVNPIGVRSCYDEGKRAAESLATDYRRTRGVDARVVRIFNTYGPRMLPSDGRVVSNFIVQALQNQPLTIYGDGQQTRSFCYIDDLIEALVKTMALKENPGVLNLGNPQEHTVLELADLVLKLTQSSSAITRNPLPSDDPIRRCPDIRKARALLQWMPRVSLNDGLKQTINYFRSDYLASV